MLVLYHHRCLEWEEPNLNKKQYEAIRIRGILGHINIYLFVFVYVVFIAILIFNITIIIITITL